MANRREVNSLHEAAVVNAAVRAHNELVGAAFSVENRPDPPDAILVDGNQRTWIEHTDAFYPGWAEDLTSFAASDKEHRPMHKGPHIGMDNQIAEAFVKVILSKFNNKSYKSIVKQYGPGILVVGLESPWLDDETLQAINRKWGEIGAPDLTAVFSWVYLGFRAQGENRAVQWVYT